jgi:hypothetical protein
MASAISTASLLASGMGNQNVMMEAAVSVMKMSNNIAKQEGDALVQLIENSAPQTSGRLLDTYA